MNNKLIVNDKTFAEYIKRLIENNDDITRKIVAIAYGKTTSEILTVADVREMKKYSRYLDGRKSGVVRLTINSNTLRHMFKRGHLTGVAQVGDNDDTPLDALDWVRIEDVFINPDIVRLNKGKLQIDKWYKDKHLRLVTSKSKGMRRSAVITFFDFVKDKKK